MKKLFASLAVVLSLLTVSIGSASAASGYGVSANTTKSKYVLGVDKEVVVAVKNDNSYAAGANLVAQRYVNGKWVNLDWNSPNPLNPEEKYYDTIDMAYFYNTAGTYRFEVEVDRYDKEGYWVSTDGIFYTSTFTISK